MIELINEAIGKLVKENLDNYLKPKSKEEIIKELNKWNIDEKIEAISNFFTDIFHLLENFLELDSNDDVIISILLENIDDLKTLKDIIKDLMNYNNYNSTYDYADIILTYADNNGDIDVYDKSAIVELLQNYFNKTKDEKILNDLIIDHIEIVSMLVPNMTDDDYFEN